MNWGKVKLNRKNLPEELKNGGKKEMAVTT
jgi:hypothetical protein